MTSIGERIRLLQFGFSAILSGWPLNERGIRARIPIGPSGGPPPSTPAAKGQRSHDATDVSEGTRLRNGGGGRGVGVHGIGKIRLQDRRVRKRHGPVAVEVALLKRRARDAAEIRRQQTRVGPVHQTIATGITRHRRRLANKNLRNLNRPLVVAGNKLLESPKSLYDVLPASRKCLTPLFQGIVGAPLKTVGLAAANLGRKRRDVRMPAGAA